MSHGQQWPDPAASRLPDDPGWSDPVSATVEGALVDEEDDWADEDDDREYTVRDDAPRSPADPDVAGQKQQTPDDTGRDTWSPDTGSR